MESAKARRRASRRKPLKRIYGLWTRFGFLILVIGVSTLAAAGLIAKAIRPYREASIQSRQLSRTDQQIAALDAQNTALQRRINYLQTPDGVVTEARAMGYVRQGEVPIIIAGGESRWSEHPLPAQGSHVDHSLSARFHGLWQRITGHGR